MTAGAGVTATAHRTIGTSVPSSAGWDVRWSDRPTCKPIASALRAVPNPGPYPTCKAIASGLQPSQPQLQQSKTVVTSRTAFDGSACWIAAKCWDSTGQSCAGRYSTEVLHSPAKLDQPSQTARARPGTPAHGQARDPHVRGAAPLRSCNLASYPPPPRHHVPHPAPLGCGGDGAVIFLGWSKHPSTPQTPHHDTPDKVAEVVAFSRFGVLGAENSPLDQLALLLLLCTATFFCACM